MYKIVNMYAPKGSKCRAGHQLTPQYITIHNTANTSKGAGARNHGKYLRGAGASKSVSWHWVIDDRYAVACIPESENAWHAGDGGSGTGNRKSLAIEICENPDSNLKEATDNAAALTAHLMRKYSIPLSHIVQHHHWSGKNCPRQIRAGNPYSWDTFLSKVMQAYETESGTAAPAPAEPETGKLYRVQVGAYAVYQNAVRTRDELKRAGYDAFIV